MASGRLEWIGSLCISLAFPFMMARRRETDFALALARLEASVNNRPISIPQQTPRFMMRQSPSIWDAWNTDLTLCGRHSWLSTESYLADS